MTGSAPVRIALSIASGASLGAYEAGAAAGLVVALQRLNERDARAGRAPSVQVDAVGGTSAGAMVGLLVVRCLLAGLDPVAVLHEGWVEKADLQRLTRGRREAPLTLATVHDDTMGLLEPQDRRGRPRHRVPSGARQRRPVQFAVGLSNLQGLSYPIDATDGGPVHSGLAHADVARFTLRPDDDRERYVQPERSSPLDAALASMSHPALFDPRVLDRRPEEERYRRAGVTNFPGSGHYWYADGGALVPHPLGNAIEAARQVDAAGWGAAAGDAHRVHVLVHPHTAAPGDDGRWTDPGRKPAWGDTLVRLVTTLTVEALYTDLRGVGDVNARLHRLDRLADVLAPHLDDAAAEAIRDVLGDHAPGTPAELLRRALHAAGGVAGKAPVATEVVSPMRLLQAAGEAPSQGQEQVPDLLAGEFLVRFGGFGGRAFRHSDFVLGWRSTRTWLPGALDRAGLPEDAVAAAVAAVDEREVDYGSPGRRGRSGLRDVPVRTRLRMAGALAHGGRSLLAEVVRGRRHG